MLKFWILSVAPALNGNHFVLCKGNNSNNKMLKVYNSRIKSRIGKWYILQIYHGENKLDSMGWWWCQLCTKPTRLAGFYSASSLKQQSVIRHVAPMRHIILISLVLLLNAACLVEKQQITILYSLVWPDRDWNPQSTALEVSTLTILPTMRFKIIVYISRWIHILN